MIFGEAANAFRVFADFSARFAPDCQVFCEFYGGVKRIVVQ
jgi:hypothetical protein